LRDFRLYLGGLIATILLSGCASQIEYMYQEDVKRHAAEKEAAEAANQARIAAAVQPFIGHGYWVERKRHLVVCPQPQDLGNCVIRLGHVTIDGYEPDGDFHVWLRVTFDGAPAAWTQISPGNIGAFFLRQAPPPEITIYPSFLDRLPKKVADERRKLPGIVLGMREYEVLASAWGAPLSKKTHSAHHRERLNRFDVFEYDSLKEDWRYPHGNVLHFDDGVLEGFEK